MFLKRERCHAGDLDTLIRNELFFLLCIGQTLRSHGVPSTSLVVARGKDQKVARGVSVAEANQCGRCKAQFLTPPTPEKFRALGMWPLGEEARKAADMLIPGYSDAI